jgi:3-polyprenyl-4-hydroxybenzoate decarboxylase
VRTIRKLYKQYITVFVFIAQDYQSMSEEEQDKVNEALKDNAKRSFLKKFHDWPSVLEAAASPSFEISNVFILMYT